jgi:hypothetical protein
MSKLFAALAFAAAFPAAVPAAAAWLTDDDTARLAERAFQNWSDAQHMDMTADSAEHLHGTQRYVRFHTQYAVSDVEDGWAFFLVDRLSGGVWRVHPDHCTQIESPTLAQFRVSLHVERNPGPQELPPTKYCRLTD